MNQGNSKKEKQKKIPNQGERTKVIPEKNGEEKSPSPIGAGNPPPTKPAIPKK
jgi:hypothetical protein